MPTSYRPYQSPDQIFLMPPSPRDWLPEGHLAYFISDTVDRLDLSAFYQRYEGDGRRNSPFDPRMMVKILLYGYATGVRSSRKMAITGQLPERVLADAGYKGETNFEQLETKGIDAYVSLARERKKASSRPDEGYPASQRMYDKLQSPTGRMNYRKRKGIVEPVYGWIKEILGFRRFSLRGVEKVTSEWDLVCVEKRKTRKGLLPVLMWRRQSGLSRTVPFSH